MQENNPNPYSAPPEEVYYGVGSFLWEVVKVFFWALVIIMPIRIFLFQPFFVQGASMEPNFDNGDYLIINEMGYKQTSIDFSGTHLFTVDSFKELQRGDSIVFKYPKNPSQFFIKRVIALPGEEIRIEKNKVTIINDKNPNGFVLDERAYLSEKVPTTISGSEDLFSMKLTKDQYFVMGDNRQYSHDSRAWGPLDKSFVTGRVLVRAWPIPKASIF